MNLIEELEWRGMIHTVMPGTAEQLAKEVTTAYVGFDPTSNSLHIGNLVTIMLLVHLQRAGHRPLALVGGATGMVGDPSGKSVERNLLDADTLTYNQAGIQKQLEQFLDFENGDNAAEIVNNYDWFKDMSFLDFIRDVGKHITVNYMMAKDSVKSRLETGLSFTEFSYQLVQGYDFYHLHKEKNCRLQMGGSDQWGNIVTGTELIRRNGGKDAFALTCPLITKADGGKFGKTESGSVWLDPEKTSVYKFYQFWLNCSDEDAVNFIKIFTLLTKDEIEALEKQHAEAPHERPIQKALAIDVTTRVHSEKELNLAIEASEILFGKGTSEMLQKLSGGQLLDIFEGVPQSEVSKSELEAGIPIIDFVSSKTGIFASNGEARRMLKNNGVSINKEKVTDSITVGSKDMIDDKYVLVQKGKKNYFLVKAV
ncbi:MAG: tyrosine--tRNA ligase [Flavobacteriales bacterium]|nr:tyrosine--tRNA ligase [Flavobacteriales bacterium]